jgi:hypothetical protein
MIENTFQLTTKSNIVLDYILYILYLHIYISIKAQRRCLTWELLTLLFQHQMG